MSDPLGFLYKDSTETQQNKNPQKPDPLGFLYKKSTAEQPKTGFIDYVNNLATHWFKVAAVSQTLGNDPSKDPPFTDPQMIQIRNAIRQSQKNGSGADIAFKDFSNFFGKFFENSKAEVSKIASAPGQAFDSFKTDPIGFFGGVGKSFVTPIGDLAELSTGVHLTEDDVSALTPEEKAKRIKSTVAVGVMAATGMGTAKSLEAFASGSLAKRALKGAAEASAAGGTYGLVSRANEADQLSETLINGVMFAPLGTALEMLHKGAPVERPVKQSSAEVAQLRQVQDIESKSFLGVTQQAEALRSADDLATAVLDGSLGVPDKGAIHIPGVDPTKIGEMSSKIPSNFRSAIYRRSDGLVDLLVYDKHKLVPGSGMAGHPENVGAFMADAIASGYRSFADAAKYMKTDEFETFFAKNGFLSDQQLSYNGTDNWKFVGPAKTFPDAIVVENLHDSGNRQIVPRSSVRALTDVRTAGVQKELTDKLYGDWIKDIGKKQSERPTPTSGVSKLEPIGFDETPPEHVLDKVPEENLQKHLDDFLNELGFGGDVKKSLANSLQDRLAMEAHTRELSSDERSLVEQGKAIRNTQQVTFDSNGLGNLARSNNMSISDGGSGRVIVRDLQSNRILAGFDNPKEAASFINKSGQATGVDLDQPNSISGSSASGGGGLPPDPPNVSSSDFPYNFFNAAGRTIRALGSEHLIRGLDNVALLTRNREWMLNVDGKYGTKLYASIMEPLQRAANGRNAKMTPYIEKVGSIEKLMKGMTKLQREDIGRWMQTMSPDEVAAKFMSRPMNALEMSIGREIAASNVDLERVFKYNRELEKLGKEFEDRTNPAIAEEYSQRVATAKAAYGMDTNHLAVAEKLDQIGTMSKKEASMGAIVRYARSVMDNEQTRSQFAAGRKMSFDQLRTGNMLENMYGELADRFGIKGESRLGGFMTHARLYTDGNISRAIRQFAGDSKAREFYAKMARTGEISAYEMDPIRAIHRYIKAGLDSEGFSEALANAKNSLAEEIKKIPDKASKRVGEVANRFIDDIRGFPDAGDQFAQAAVDHYSDMYKLGLSDNVRKQWVGGISSVINAAGIGMRPVMGAFHWATATMVSIADRGLTYTKRVHEQGAYAKMHPEVLDEIRNRGGLSTVSSVGMYDAEELAAQPLLKNAATGIGEAMLKISGLPTVFEMLSAGHYLTTQADAVSAITRFNRDEITWKQAKKELYLDKHYEPVKRQFESMVQAGKDNEAAQFLAGETVRDMVGMFGNASHPYKWGSNWGRLAGQFGNWPLWLRSTVTRMASRGTWGQRISSVAKLTAISWLGVKAGEELGIDLSKLNILKSMFWFGGPMESIAEDVHDALKGTGQQQQNGQRRLLKLMPINKDRYGNVTLQPSIFVPGSFAIDDIVKGIQDLQSGNDVPGLWELAGGRKNNSLSQLRQTLR